MAFTDIVRISFINSQHRRGNNYLWFRVINISWGVAWGKSLVRTWRTILSGLFLKCGIIKNFISSMVATGNIRIFMVFCFDILYSLRPDKIESLLTRFAHFLWMVLTAALIFKIICNIQVENSCFRIQCYIHVILKIM